jgi:hypothetical protein
MEISEQRLKYYDRVLATLTAITIIVGGLWTFWKFIDQRNLEIKKITFDEKKALYYELVNAEAEIASSMSYEEVVVAQKRFRNLYSGRSHIIAKLDPEVENQKVVFMGILNEYIKTKPPERPFKYFNSPSLRLAELCRKYLEINDPYK